MEHHYRLDGDLMAFTNGTTTTNNGVFLTVEPNTVWNGRITLSGSLASGTGSASAQSATPNIVFNGNDGNFLDADVITKLQLNTPAQALGALSGTVCHGDVVLPTITIQARSNTITLTLVTGGATAACATAIGE